MSAFRHALRSPAASAPLGNPAIASVTSRARAYFASDARRGVQTALGLLWLLDAALQFQPFMYSGGFVQQLKSNASGQPNWAASSIDWAANVAHQVLPVFNTLFALIQLAIAVGLLYRRTVKPAIALSIAWTFGVWWFGEGFGMVFAGTANPLTGAPGAALIYALVAVLVWPSVRPAGLLSVRAARAAWGVLWLGMAYLWLLPATSSADATFNAIMMSPAGMAPPDGMLWLTRIDGQAELAAMGNGEAIALILATVSLVIAVAVWVNWRPTAFLALAIVLSLGYWVIGQAFGGIFFTANATDPNAGPPLVLLALVMYSLSPIGSRAGAPAKPRPAMLLGWLAAAVTVAVTGTAVGVSAAEAAGSTASQPVQPVAYESPFDGLAISPPVAAPPVSLHNYRGDPVTLAAYSERGDAVLLTFLSVDCPADCPAIASGLRQALAALPAAEARRLQVVVISTNPLRDNPRVVGGFLHRYGLAGRAQYLTGSPMQLRPVWREWGISATSDTVDLSGPNALVFGIASTGAVMTRYSAFFTPKQIDHDVKRLHTQVTPTHHSPRRSR